MFSTLILSTLIMSAAQEPVEASGQSQFHTTSQLYYVAMTEYYQKLEAMYESGEFTELVNPIEEFWGTFKAIAKDKSIESSERAQAQIWCVTNFGDKNWAYPDKVFMSLSKLFISEYADSEFASEYTSSLRYLQLDRKIKTSALDLLSAATTSDAIRAHCMLASAFAYADNSQQDLADKTVDALIEKYPSSQAAKDATPLLVRRQLQIGKVVPALGGVDVDGKERHLKDTRGKVTFVVFWGFWWGPCKGEIPTEKALVERYADQDFAIFGVNTDDSKEEYLKQCKEMGVTWKSIFTGGGPDSAADAWGVEYYPTSYLLDASGVIRYKDLRGEQLEEKVAELMAELN